MDPAWIRPIQGPLASNRDLAGNTLREDTGDVSSFPSWRRLAEALDFQGSSVQGTHSLLSVSLIGSL